MVALCREEMSKCPNVQILLNMFSKVNCAVRVSTFHLVVNLTGPGDVS